MVTFAEQSRRDGADIFAATKEGAIGRLRAILMTAAAMISGMLPMAIGFAEGGSQSAPLGRAVIGKLTVSTFTTLTILPSIYAILQRGASILSPSLLLICLVAVLPAAWSQTPDMAAVISKPISRTIDLPGEFLPFLNVSLHAKVAGYVDRVLVDRGSAVRKGQLLAELSAPEMKAQLAEAQFRWKRRKRIDCKQKRNSPLPRVPEIGCARQRRHVVRWQAMK